MGDFDFYPGLYIYVGSAWGPGGLTARLQRHLRGSQNTRWHIDYLRRITVPTAAWIAPYTRQECAWAQALHDHPHASVPVPRFGASDCRCPSHLYYFQTIAIALDRFHLPGSPIFIQL
ncbi:MAG: GIY-YIG nuclease family protein [Anaerolineae bacterium]|nr:GIY-YIG nuclease family protein [Anaerolineae bacterium]